MADPQTYQFLQPLVNQWMEKIRLAEKAKEGFNEIAEQCDAFFSKASGFMWKPNFKEKYLGKDVMPPKFQVTINKAFELVALFGPYLFWKYPGVWIQSYDPIKLSPEAFGDPNDEMVQQIYQQAEQETAIEQARRRTRNSIMQLYLSYSQREQPGGLAMAAELAITEALVKGRGLLWTEAYEFPGSSRTLVGQFWDTVDNLLIDPDCKSPDLSDAMFIVRKHCSPGWKLADKLGYPRDFFTRHGVGSYESANSRATNTSDSARQQRRNGGAHDLVEWYEIWSKCGVGSRLSYSDDKDVKGLSSGLHDAFDEVVGDYAYLVIVDGIPYPLNAPATKIRPRDPERPAATDDEVKAMFAWRAPNYGPEFPCYLDDRWPVAMLDFYRNYGSPWPIAPLAPALGELICLNIMISAYTEQAYENRKHVIAYMEEAIKTLEGKLNSSQSPVLIPIQQGIAKNINEVIQYLNKPEMNRDLGEAIAFISSLFDKRTGLTEFMYAVSSTQSRSARDVAAKEEKASIRPEKMANDVARFLTDSFTLVKFLSGWVVSGQDLVSLLGKYGAYFWDQLIAADDPEVFVREMQCTIEANECRKPNRERMMANLQDMMQYMIPMLQQYATDTGDTKPINAFLEKLGESMEEDVTPWELGPWRPEPDPAMQQMQQMQMQLEQAKLQAEVQTKQMEAQAKQAEIEKAQIETQRAMIDAQAQSQAAEAELQKKQLEFAFDQAAHQQELIQDQNQHVQELDQKRQEFLLSLMQKREEGAQKIQQMRDEGAVKVEVAKRTAAAKPKAKPVSKGTA